MQVSGVDFSLVGSVGCLHEFCNVLLPQIRLFAARLDADDVHFFIDVVSEMGIRIVPVVQCISSESSMVASKVSTCAAYFSSNRSKPIDNDSRASMCMFHAVE
jgi:hypothetical protein